MTAGNASQQNDAAAAMLVVAEDRLDELGLEPIGFLDSWAAAGCEPALMGLGPVAAVSKLFARTGARFDDFDLVELNEAFACQVLGVVKEWGFEDLDRLNVNGSGISLGHPVGATGARMATTALHELGRRGGGKALLTMCIGGGRVWRPWWSLPDEVRFWVHLRGGSEVLRRQSVDECRRSRHQWRAERRGCSSRQGRTRGFGRHQLVRSLRASLRHQSSASVALPSSRTGICVTDLSVALGMSGTAVSHALRLLRSQGWVSATRDGRSMRYQLADDTVHQLLHSIGATHFHDETPTPGHTHS